MDIDTEPSQPSPLEKSIKLISERPEEGVTKRTFEISPAAVEQSEFLRTCLAANKDEIRIPAEPGVRDHIVELVLEFLEYRANHPDSKDEMDNTALDKVSSLNLCTWDKEFLEKMDIPTYLRVMLAANFLNIPTLLTVAQKHLANVIKSKKPEELKAYFTIPDDVSDDQRKP